jgi:N-acetylglucosamine malate deacetylase 1
VKSLVIAPHPDDEVLGCGGTILKRKKEGASIAWLLITKMENSPDWTQDQAALRDSQILKIQEFFGFEKVFQLGYSTMKLDQVPMLSIVRDISNVLDEFKPNEVFIPFEGDVHSDHRIVHEAAISSTKTFRAPYIDCLLSYETLSETEFNLSDGVHFKPNYFVNIEEYLEEKIEAMKIYASEVGEFPFPRSIDALNTLAKYRGSNSGLKAAEAFKVLKEIQK